MRITFFSAKPYEIKYLTKANKENLDLVFLNERLTKETLHLAKGSDAISVFTNDDASAEMLEGLRQINVKFVATRSAGFDHIDIKRAEELCISVANVPGYSPYSIAEHAIAMILCLNRKLVQADKQIKAQNFRLDSLIGFDLNNKTVGIIGTGKIGGIVAKILSGFGCRILAFDPYPNKDYIKAFGVEYVDLQRVYEEANIITLHCPLTPGTKYLINEGAIKSMKKGVMIINTGRGGLIDTSALIQGLKEGKIGSAGLDVYENEKPLYFENHENEVLQDDIFARLLTFKNVLVTGHQAFLTQEALKNIADTTIHNLSSFRKGTRPKSTLTKELAS